MPRRAPNELRPLDDLILGAGLELHARGVAEFHGYELSRTITSSSPVGHTTLYRALDALVGMGLLAARWEPKDQAAREGRPPRHYYRLTAQAETAYRTWNRVQTSRQRMQ